MKQKRNKLRQSWDFFNEKMCYDNSIKIYQKPLSFSKRAVYYDCSFFIENNDKEGVLIMREHILKSKLQNYVLH